MPQKRKINPLFQEATPEVLRNKIFELAAMKYTPLVISIMLEGLYDPIKISARHVDDFLTLNESKVVIWRRRLTEERIPTREELIRRITDLLAKRFRRAIEDFKAYETLSEKRRNEEISEESYQMQTKTLYLPTSIELINLVNAIDKKFIVPAKNSPAGSDDQVGNDEPEPIVDEGRKAAIEKARADGDMIKLQELMFPAPTPPKA